MASVDSEQLGLQLSKGSIACLKAIGYNMKRKDNNRTWMWWLLVVGLSAQCYFVRELVAAFALFTLGFVAIAFLAFCVYIGTLVWEMGVTRSAAGVRFFVVAACSGADSAELTNGNFQSASLPTARRVLSFLLQPERVESEGLL